MSFRSTENLLYNLDNLHKKDLNMADATEYCLSQGQHLTSVGSEKENDDIKSEADRCNPVWRRTAGIGWIWEVFKNISLS